MREESRRYAGMSRRWTAVFLVLGSATAIPALAAEDAAEPESGVDEITITVLEEGATPADIMSIIELPEAAARQGDDANRKGKDAADGNREASSERTGERIGNRPETRELPEAAEAARDRAEAAREQADSAADNASDEILDRVGRGNAEGLPDDVRERLPDNLPGPDDRPDPPSPPGRDGGG